MASYIKVGETPQVVRPKDGKAFTLEELQNFVGGYIERISLGDGVVMYVNEDGRLEGLPRNAVATAIASQVIVGDVIVGVPPEVE